MGRLLRLEDKLAAYRARQEAESKVAWLAPMLPRLLGGPPSPALWRAIYGDRKLTASITPYEDILLIVLMNGFEEWDRHGPPTLAELWHDLERISEWMKSEPADPSWPGESLTYEQATVTHPDLVAWWDTCPLPRLVAMWRGQERRPKRLAAAAWVEELLALLGDGAGWYMAEVVDAGGAVVERFPWPWTDTTPAAERLEAARLAERALEALGALEAAKRPATLVEVREWLQTLRES